MKKYLGQWDNFEDLKNEFKHSNKFEVTEKQILIAIYEYEDYSGSAFVLFKQNKSIYEVNDQHCSCNGLENWSPEKTSIEEIRYRCENATYGILSRFKEEILETLEKL